MNNSSRICDFCLTSTAILYCTADTAKLCLSCDNQVHSTNQLFTKHSRSLLCDSCHSSPSTILCCSESLSLCHNCDWESHRDSQIHERRPLESFVGCPSWDETAGWLGLETIEFKEKELVSDLDDFEEGYLVWDTPSIVSIEGLVGSNHGCERSFQAMGVPPLPKNRKAACGKYKEEILRQLQEMAKSDPKLNDGHEDVKSISQFQFSEPQEDLYSMDMYTGFGTSVDLNKVSPFKDGSFWGPDHVDFANESLSSNLLGSHFEDSCLVPDNDSDINGDTSRVNYSFEEQATHQIKTESPPNLPKFIPRELTSEERDLAISRYKEKKRTRRYDKHIRYESRRIRAENRKRVKGRFAKIDHQSTG